MKSKNLRMVTTCFSSLVKCDSLIFLFLFLFVPGQSEEEDVPSSQPEPHPRHVRQQDVRTVAHLPSLEGAEQDGQKEVSGELHAFMKLLFMCYLLIHCICFKANLISGKCSLAFGFAFVFK